MRLNILKLPTILQPLRTPTWKTHAPQLNIISIYVLIKCKYATNAIKSNMNILKSFMYLKNGETTYI